MLKPGGTIVLSLKNKSETIRSLSPKGTKLIQVPKTKKGLILNSLAFATKHCTAMQLKHGYLSYTSQPLSSNPLAPFKIE